jgi:hypothetical protein
MRPFIVVISYIFSNSNPRFSRSLKILEIHFFPLETAPKEFNEDVITGIKHGWLSKLT